MSDLQQNTHGSGAQSRSDTGFFGQPRVLANLFGVELWERFSFYGMQGILLIYLYYSAAQGGLGIDEAVATGIVGAYGGAVYLSTILGAWLADRLIGPERTLFYAAICVMAGHIALAVVPGPRRRRARPGADRPRLRRREGQRDLAGRRRSTTSTTRAATRASRCSTWASTSAPCSARC